MVVARRPAKGVDAWRPGFAPRKGEALSNAKPGYPQPRPRAQRVVAGTQLVLDLAISA